MMPKIRYEKKIVTVNDVPIYELDSVYVAIISTDTLHITDIGTTIESFRKSFPDVLIQGINPKNIFGIDHIFEVIQIVLESNNRKIQITKRLEMEILLRLVSSSQVNKAIDIAGIKNDSSGCFILLSNDKHSLIYSIDFLRTLYFKQNLALLSATRDKMTYICKRLEFRRNNYGKKEFLKILTERAALVSL